MPVRAEIAVDSEFSVHADASDLLDWVRALTPAPARSSSPTASPPRGPCGRLHAELGVPAVVPSTASGWSLSPTRVCRCRHWDRDRGWDWDHGGARPESTGAAEHRPSEAASDSIAVQVQVPAGLPGLTRADLSGIPVSGAQVTGELTARSDGPDLVLEGTMSVRIRRARA